MSYALFLLILIIFQIINVANNSIHSQNRNKLLMSRKCSVILCFISGTINYKLSWKHETKSKYIQVKPNKRLADAYLHVKNKLDSYEKYKIWRYNSNSIHTFKCTVLQ